MTTAVDLAVRTPDPHALVLEAVAALPLPTDDEHQRWSCRRSTAAWLLSMKSVHTRRAYFRDISNFLTWCEEAGLDPRFAQRADVDTYAVSARARFDLSETSVSRMLSTLSSWYSYLMSNAAVTANPVLAVSRPTVDRDSSTTAGLTGPEVRQFMKAARRLRSLRDRALLAMMAELGLRVGEALGLDVEDFRMNRGHRTVRVHGKGGKTRELPVPVPLGRDLDGWLEVRGSGPGPLFTTRTGRRVQQKEAFLLVRRVGRNAGLPGADQLSPHSLRHTVATAALDAGAALRDVQDLMGHADPRTTRRYDRNRGSLDRSPAYLISGLFSEDEDEA